MFKPVLFCDLKSYSWSKFRSDLFAGLTVGVVALPLAMAFAIACGLPPERGIYTAIVGGFLVALLGGSRYQVSGPTGAFIVIIVAIIGQHGFGGLVLATLMAGVILILLGAFRLGALIKFVPFPVVTGFTSGIAVVIFSTQLKDIFGLDVEMPADFVGKIVVCAQNFGSIHWRPLLLCAGCAGAIFACRRYFPRLPSMLAGMLLATLIAVIFKLDVETIGMRFGALPSSLPAPAFPDFIWRDLPDLFMPAVTIALLAAIESLLSATVADGMTGERHRSDTELIAQGIGNIGAVIFGGIPVTGALARTAVNIKSGAKTSLSGVIHAVTLLGILLLFGSFARMIPLAALAGVMVVVCYNMSEIHAFTRMFRGPRGDWGVMVITFAITILVDLVAAVQVGVLLAAFLFIRKMALAADVKLIRSQEEEDSETYDPDATAEKDIPSGVAVFEVQGPFFFGAVDAFQETVMGMLRSKAPRLVVVRLRHVPVVDASGLNVIADFAGYCRKRNLPLIFSGVQPQPYKMLKKYGIVAEVGEKNVCPDIDKALLRVDEILAESQNNGGDGD